SEICSSVSSGTAGSPRRFSASSRCALSMARSPPLTATYMSASRHVQRARQPGDRLGRREQNVDSARKLRAVVSELMEEVRGEREGGKPPRAENARAAQDHAFALGNMRDLEHHGGRVVGKFETALREACERRRRGRRGQEREGGVRRIVSNAGAGVEG